MMRKTSRPGKSGKLRCTAKRLCVLLLAASCLAAGGGCTRRFFRLRADNEVAIVINEKDKYPAWKVETYHVYPDPKARFADPTDPDHPPKPPDDPAAFNESPNAQPAGKNGTTYLEGTGYLEILRIWDEENRRELERRRKQEQQEGEAAKKTSSFTIKEIDRSNAETTDEGKPGVLPAGYVVAPGSRPYLIGLDQAIELGLINNREYQDRREDLFLAALPVTLNRFSFATQFFATEESIRQRLGRDFPGGPSNNWSLNSATGFGKQFATGAMLMARFANQTVLELTGSRKHTFSQSTVSLDILQPLLRGGGRAVTLEPLTQSERNLLYEARQFARFRKEYFATIATGTQLSSSTGGISGLALLTGVGIQREGYLPTVLDAALLANQEKNVDSLKTFLGLFESIKEGGDIGQLNVDQVEQQLLGARSSVLRQQQEYRDSIDRFKVVLGLTPTMPLVLDDTPIRPMQEQLARYEDILNDFEAVRASADKLTAKEQLLVGISFWVATGPLPGSSFPLALSAVLDPAASIPDLFIGELRPRLKKLAAQTGLVKGTKFQKEFPVRWAEWEKLSDADLAKRLTDLIQEKRILRERQVYQEKVNRTLSPAELERMGQLERGLDLAQLESDLRTCERRTWQNAPNQERRLRQYLAQSRDVVNDFVQLMAEPRNERLLLVRQVWPDLPAAKVWGVDLLTADDESAQTVIAQTTLTNRLDLMNARAQLVDTWRQVAVSANSLMGVLDVQYNLTALSPANVAQPFNLNGSRSRNQLSLNGELPLVRKAERNQYRATLIGYQRQRRALMLAEDVALTQVRQELRQLRQLAENYKIQQRVTELAYLNVESALETFNAPPIPTGSGGGGGGSNAGNAAALTSQLLSSQSAVVRAQDQLYTIWVNYQIARIQLFRDLELMRVDTRGAWIDESATSEPTSRDGVPESSWNIWRDGEPQWIAPERLHQPAANPIKERPGS